MEKYAKPKTTRISLLIFLSMLLPLVGLIGAMALEESTSSPKKALFFWGVVILLTLASLGRAHVLARNIYQFKALYPFVLLAAFILISSFGWVSNNVWYSYYAFSDITPPDFTMSQSRKYPNHFVFKGSIDDGAEDRLVSKILGANNVDWDEPIVLEVSSDGGSPEEAILMAEFVNQYNIQVEVMMKCISACTYLLVSSDARYVHPRAWVGFHAAYSQRKGQEPNYNNPSLRFYDEWLDKRLAKLGVGQEFREQAQVQDAAAGFFPSYEEMQEVGISNQSKRHYMHDDKPPKYL